MDDDGLDKRVVLDDDEVVPLREDDSVVTAVVDVESDDLLAGTTNIVISCSSDRDAPSEPGSTLFDFDDIVILLLICVLMNIYLYVHHR